MSVPATATAAAGPLGACLTALPELPPPDLSLPALEPVKNREVYRQRPESELEEAVWYSAEEPDTLVEPTMTRLRSIHSKQATVITFANKSPFKVRTLWIDFSGNEVVYSVLEPNSTRRYHSYSTHPWIVRELHNGTRMLLSGRPAVVGLAEEQTVEVAAPPKLEWSLGSFSAFPDSYKAGVHTLLRAHKALEQFAQPASMECSTPQPVQLTPPCSPVCTVPCSPRATIAHQGGLPTSPKTARLSVRTASTPASPAPNCCTPRALPLAGSPAGSGDGAATATTSISISSEASHFRATLTVSSPTRAVLQQTLNISVNHQLGPLAQNTATTVNIDNSFDAAAASSSADPIMRPPSASSSRSGPASGGSSRRAGKGKSGLFNNLVHSFKHAFRPSVRHVPEPAAPQPAAPTTHIHLHLSQLLSSATPEPMEVDEEPAAAPGPWPPVGTHLGHLPSHLLATIAEMAAPVVWQTLDQAPKGRPDIQPTLLACPPKTEEEVAAELAAEQQQQQQQQQQADGDAGQDDDMPALV